MFLFQAAMLVSGQDESMSMTVMPSLLTAGTCDNNAVGGLASLTYQECKAYARESMLPCGWDDTCKIQSGAEFERWNRAMAPGCGICPAAVCGGNGYVWWNPWTVDMGASMCSTQYGCPCKSGDSFTKFSMVLGGIKEADLVSDSASKTKAAVESGVALSIGEPVENVKLLQVGNQQMAVMDREIAVTRQLKDGVKVTLQVKSGSQAAEKAIMAKIKATIPATFVGNIKTEAAKLGVGESFAMLTAANMEVTETTTAPVTFGVAMGGKEQQMTTMKWGDGSLITAADNQTGSSGVHEETLIAAIAGSISFCLLALLTYLCRNNNKTSNNHPASPIKALAVDMDPSVVIKPAASQPVVVHVMGYGDVDKALQKYGSPMQV